MIRPSVLSVVVSLRIWKNGQAPRSARYDRRAYIWIVSVYVLINAVLILEASKGG